MEDGMSVVTDPDVLEVDPEEGVPAESVAEEPVSAPQPREVKPESAPRRAILFGLIVVVALATLLCWMGFRVHQSRQAQDQRSQFLQVARQGALNLTTIDWHHADGDVRRILDSATGEFYNDFARRAKPFIEVLQQAKATTVGTITEAGLSAQTADGAEALVAVSVQTSNAVEADPVPRLWRMRITVQKVGDQVKVCNVGFVQ
jgi:Mce-associated membrane protein